MGMVVPGEEPLTEGTACSIASESRAGTSGLELRFRVRIVIADMRPAVALGDTEVDEQQRHGLGAHQGAAVGMQGELPAGDVLLVAGGGDELMGELGRLPRRDHPADHAGEQLGLGVGGLGELIAPRGSRPRRAAAGRRGTTRTRDIYPILDQVTAGLFDDPGGNGEPIVVQHMPVLADNPLRYR